MAEFICNLKRYRLLKDLTQEQLAPFLNAGTLMNKGPAQEVMAALPAEAQGLFATLLDNVNSAYAGSLRVVFIVLLCLLAIALVSMLLLKEQKPEG